MHGETVKNKLVGI